MSFTEITLIMFIALILFGPEDLPVIARALGKIVLQIRKITQEITQEFQQAINAPSEVISEALKEVPAKSKTSKPEDKAKDNEELLSYEDEAKDVSLQKPVQETNPLTELPSEIITLPKDTQAGEQ
ncbi:MAG TPA: twin-arginine translocase TatA/TatE family subunit [Peptococcaceae bacterium]|nr:twin-arginine translocase TatA/TatE family subunit [Peptococcaceae bacterium]